MQQLWHAKLEWDTPLPVDMANSWNRFINELPRLNSISLPRHIDVRNYKEIQLIGFSDASGKGYAGSIYLRVVHHTGDISVYFVTCKTKVAPLKNGDANTSMPRLELCGALLVAQTLHRVYNCLMSEISISAIQAWTDSTVVLAWLKTDKKDFKIFVTNRVAKIHSLLPNCKWEYVNTKDNPADPASRGLLPYMVLCKIHIDGPAFLRLPVKQWPL
ncbi:uncharacterized protein LOC126910121, partial [Daktulosphaira vitifoliae]|uniref:uncharacterized protein LOC126910121 n=1 Tax=Daktulosphaira vitifoliae TaxID=58002 RepID=UPI0021A9C868